MARRRIEWTEFVKVQRRLKRASFRLEMAQLERTWAVLSASRQDWSVRDIAEAVGLSATRVHQIVSKGTAYPVEEAQSVLREAGWPAPEDDAVSTGAVGDRLSEEAALIKQCAEWLTLLEADDHTGGRLVISLLPENDRAGHHIGHVDHARVIRILRRIAADIEELGRSRTVSDTSFANEEAEPVQRIRRRLAEPDIEKPKGRASIHQSRRAWDKYEKAMRQAGLTPPPNPYAHLGTFIDTTTPWRHRSAN